MGKERLAQSALDVLQRQHPTRIAVVPTPGWPAHNEPLLASSTPIPYGNDQNYTTRRNDVPSLGHLRESQTDLDNRGDTSWF